MSCDLPIMSSTNFDLRLGRRSSFLAQLRTRSKFIHPSSSSPSERMAWALFPCVCVCVCVCVGVGGWVGVPCRALQTD